MNRRNFLALLGAGAAAAAALPAPAEPVYVWNVTATPNPAYPPALPTKTLDRQWAFGVSYYDGTRGEMVRRGLIDRDGNYTPLAFVGSAE